jgi:long-chain acyl-CoA synthetase
MIVSFVEEHAAERSESVALRFDDKVLTYSALAREIDRAVILLQAAGVSAETTIAAYCENNIEIMVLYYAMAKIGGTFVPVNAVLSASEVAYILGHADVKFLFTDKRLYGNALAATDSHNCQLLEVSSFFGQSMQNTARVPQVEHVDNDFLIIYTSGSTGVPKAVLYSQPSEIAGNASLIDMWQISPQDKLLVALPLGFLYGLSTAASMALQAGCEVIIQRRFHPREVLEAFVEHRVSVFQGVPTMFSMMLEYAEQNELDFDLSALRAVISAGAPLSSDLRNRFKAKFGIEIQDYYALTEVRPVFGKYIGDTNAAPAGAIGKASPCVVIKVVDGEGNEVEPGVTGEILVRAPATTTGYYKAPELTQAAFVDGYFRTGDLGHVDSNGYYYLTGRIKDIIIKGGANIAPAEVEEALLSHPDVVQASVIGVPDQKFGELPVAYFVAAAGKNPASEILAEHCRGSLAEFKVPSQFVSLAEMPLGNTGKIDKKVLLSIWKEHNQ